MTVEEAVYVRRRGVVGAYFGHTAAQDADPATVDELYNLILMSPCEGGGCQGFRVSSWNLCTRCRVLRAAGRLP